MAESFFSSRIVTSLDGPASTSIVETYNVTSHRPRVGDSAMSRAKTSDF